MHVRVNYHVSRQTKYCSSRFRYTNYEIDSYHNEILTFPTAESPIIRSLNRWSYGNDCGPLEDEEDMMACSSNVEGNYCPTKRCAPPSEWKILEDRRKSASHTCKWKSDIELVSSWFGSINRVERWRQWQRLLFIVELRFVLCCVEFLDNSGTNSPT